MLERARDEAAATGARGEGPRPGRARPPDRGADGGAGGQRGGRPPRGARRRAPQRAARAARGGESRDGRRARDAPGRRPPRSGCAPPPSRRSSTSPTGTIVVRCAERDVGLVKQLIGGRKSARVVGGPEDRRRRGRRDPRWIGARGRHARLAARPAARRDRDRSGVVTGRSRVSVVWSDVSARAKGLSTHLIGGPALRDLARTADYDSLARRAGAHAARPTARASNGAA